MKKSSRIVNLCFAIIFVLSCAVFSASAEKAIPDGDFSYNLNGYEGRITLQVYDRNGNPRPMPLDLVNGDPDFTLGAGDYVTVKAESGFYFELKKGQSIDFQVKTDQVGKMELGYETRSGDDVSVESFRDVKQAWTTIDIPSNDGYWFWIHNQGTNDLHINNVRIW